VGVAFTSTSQKPSSNQKKPGSGDASNPTGTTAKKPDAADADDGPDTGLSSTPNSSTTKPALKPTQTAGVGSKDAKPVAQQPKASTGDSTDVADPTPAGPAAAMAKDATKGSAKKEPEPLMNASVVTLAGTKAGLGQTAARDDANQNASDQGVAGDSTRPDRKPPENQALNTTLIAQGENAASGAATGWLSGKLSQKGNQTTDSQSKTKVSIGVGIASSSTTTETSIKGANVSTTNGATVVPVIVNGELVMPAEAAPSAPAPAKPTDAGAPAGEPNTPPPAKKEEPKQDEQKSSKPAEPPAQKETPPAGK
jgi:hypothetical protein